MTYNFDCSHWDVHTSEDIIGSCYKDANMQHSTCTGHSTVLKILSVLTLKLFNNIITAEVLQIMVTQ